MTNKNLNMSENNFFDTLDNEFYNHLLFDAYVKNGDGNNNESVFNVFLTYLEKFKENGDLNTDKKCQITEAIFFLKKLHNKFEKFENIDQIIDY